MAAAESLPFEDESFDGVLMNEVLLEHVADEDHSLSEIRRVLRPGGHLALLSPNQSFHSKAMVCTSAASTWTCQCRCCHGCPGILSRELLRARNYWPWELVRLVERNGFFVLARESVFPVFDVYPWMPRPLIRWYQHNLKRIETSPIDQAFQSLTLVVGERSGERPSVRDQHEQPGTTVCSPVTAGA